MVAELCEAEVYGEESLISASEERGREVWKVAIEEREVMKVM